MCIYLHPFILYVFKGHIHTYCVGVYVQYTHSLNLRWRIGQNSRRTFLPVTRTTLEVHSGSQISLPHGPHVHNYSVHLEIIRQIIATNNEGTLRFNFDTVSDLWKTKRKSKRHCANLRKPAKSKAIQQDKPAERHQNLINFPELLLWRSVEAPRSALGRARHR